MQAPVGGSLTDWFAYVGKEIPPPSPILNLCKTPGKCFSFISNCKKHTPPNAYRRFTPSSLGRKDVSEGGMREDNDAGAKPASPLRVPIKVRNSSRR